MLLVDLEVTLDAPRLVLPCGAGSSEVIVAELGGMVICNQKEVETGRVADILRMDIR